MRCRREAVSRKTANLAERSGRFTVKDKEGAMRKRWMRQGGIVVGLSVLLFLGWVAMPALADAQAKAEYNWRFGSPWPQKTRTESIQLFTELLNKYSNGKTQIKFQPRGR